MNKVNSLYIHIPFCNNICDYCDFTKLQYFRNFAISYLDALEKELKGYQIEELKTIYVGGGTPTALEDDLFEKLLAIIKPYSNGVQEYTFEANPESLTSQKVSLLKQYGVNRVSLGVQTTNQKILNELNRKHDFTQVKEAIKCLNDVGIENYNVDLILGLPHTSENILRQDLENILALNPKHISCYGLTIHPHTALFNRGFQEPEGDVLRQYYDIVNEVLVSHGFIHYEVSNWAKPGYQSEHNLTYWRNEQYFGCGLGASGYIKDIRYKNTINLDRYFKGEYIQEKEVVTSDDQKTYQIMLNLRTIEGLDISFAKGKEKEVASMIDSGLLIKKDGRLVPTYEGMMVLDQILLKLI